MFKQEIVQSVPNDCCELTIMKVLIIFVLVSCQHFAKGSDHECPQGFREIMGKCYFYSDEATNQEQAQASCK